MLGNDSESSEAHVFTTKSPSRVTYLGNYIVRKLFGTKTKNPMN